MLCEARIHNEGGTYMNLVKSIAAVTVTVLTLTGTASAADGIGGSERRNTSQEYKTYEEAEAALRKHLDEEAENASPSRSMNAERSRRMILSTTICLPTNSRLSTSPCPW